MKRVCSLTAAVVASFLGHSAFAQSLDRDLYLRTLSALNVQAALSARTRCLPQRSGNLSTYNQCLRREFVTAGGPPTAPSAPSESSERPTRPRDSLDLDALRGPPRPSSAPAARPERLQRDCEPGATCAVFVGMYASEAVARRELEIVAGQFSELAHPFRPYVRRMAQAEADAARPYQASFIGGAYSSAHLLCEAIMVSGRQCAVAAQVSGTRDQPGIPPTPSDLASDCPTTNQCAVQIGAFSSMSIGQRELQTVSSRFPELTRPFGVHIRPVTTSSGAIAYRTMFVGGSRAEAHALCNALKNAGRNCLVR